MIRDHIVVRALLPVLLLALEAGALVAQETPGGNLAEQTLRPYWHVFIAYALAIVLVMGWVVSIARRLRDVERKLGVEANATR